MVHPEIAAADPLPLPAPPVVVHFLLLLTFVLHVLPMNVLLGGAILAALARVRGAGGRDPHALELARWSGRWTPVVMAAAITFGVAPLLFLQVLYGRLFFASSIVMGAWWLAVIPIVIVAYYAVYVVAFRPAAIAGREGVVGWLTAVLLAVVGFVYSNNMTLMLRPRAVRQRYLADGRGLWLNLDDPTLVPRYLHMVLGALAVAGMVIALLGVARAARDRDFSSWAIRHGLGWFVGATLANFVAGTAWLLTMPRSSALAFMGHDLVATVCLGLGIVVGLVSVVLALAATRTERSQPLVWTATAGLVTAIVLMIVDRDRLRGVELAHAGFAPASWVVPQWGTMAIFSVLLVGSLACVGWMAAALARGRGGA